MTGVCRDNKILRIQNNILKASSAPANLTKRHELTRAPTDTYGAADAQMLSASRGNCGLMYQIAGTNLETFILSVWMRNSFYQSVLFPSPPPSRPFPKFAGRLVQPSAVKSLSTIYSQGKEVNKNQISPGILINTL